MLCRDDAERENGSAEKADKTRGLGEEFDSAHVSMTNAWTTICGDDATRKQALRLPGRKR